MRSRRGRRRPAPWTAVPVLVVAALGLLPAHAAAVVVPDLVLDPAAGPPGAPVTARVDGFDCSVGTVDVLWDADLPVATVVLGAGGGEATFPVPADTEPGLHEVFARCTGSGDLAAETSFDVEAVADQVTVPDLRGRPLDEAEALLAERGLALGEVAGEGGTVADQDPGPGDAVEAESPVDVTLAAVVPPPGPAGADDVTERSPLLWIALVGLLAAGATAGFRGLRRVRRRRDRRWVEERVRLRPAPTSPPDVTLAADPADPAGPDATLVVRLVAVPDAGDQHVEVIGP